MDNVSHHSRRLEDTPSLSWQKAENQDWVASKAFLCHAAMTKKQLLDTMATVKEKYMKHRVDAAAETAGCVVLRFPPYHCEFNTTELI